METILAISAILVSAATVAQADPLQSGLPILDLSGLGNPLEQPTKASAPFVELEFKPYVYVGPTYNTLAVGYNTVARKCQNATAWVDLEVDHGFPSRIFVSLLRLNSLFCSYKRAYSYIHSRTHHPSEARRKLNSQVDQHDGHAIGKRRTQ